MDSNVGLAIQTVGILLITLLSTFMRTSMRSAALRYWTGAWGSLSIALVSLFIGFKLGSAAQKLCYTVYFLGEYVFGLLFLAGCHAFQRKKSLTLKQYYFALPLLPIAVLLPHLSSDFNDLFIAHAAIMSIFFGAAFVSLLRSSKSKTGGPGRSVMLTALLLLSFDFLHYIPVFGARKGWFGITVPNGYLQYTSIFDLILEILLGFGTMMVLMESVRRQVEQTNRELVLARDQLELLAKMDPLTEALNRHAFHSLLSRSESGQEANTSGSVVLLDIDNLKPINDTLGHSAGDKAIRAVARAMRSMIRADDMLFRWGGDEFLVLMFKLHQSEAARRVEGLNELLEKNCRQGVGAPVNVSVSYGVAGFDSLTQLAAAIEEADLAMYAQRQKARGVERIDAEPIVDLIPTTRFDMN